MARRHFLAVLVVVCNLTGGVSRAEGQVPDAVERLRADIGQHCIFRVTADQNQGSAVLLDKDRDYLYFATCYHVLMETKSFLLLNAESRTIFSSVGKEIWFQAVPRHDLVVFKVKITDAQNLAKPIILAMHLKKAMLPIRPAPAPGAPAPVPLGFVAGFPFYNDHTLDFYAVHLGRDTENAHILLRRLEGRQPIGQRFAPIADKDPTDGLEFGYIGLRPTVPGMSGGLVLNEDAQFAGVIFGRIPDTVGLMIPAPFVSKALEYAKTKPLPRVQNKVTDFPSKPWGFSDAIRKQLDSSEINDVMRWDEFGHWINYFRDPAPFREAFQEIALPGSLLRGKAAKAPKHLQVRIGQASFDERGVGQVILWVNGTVVTFDQTALKNKKLDYAFTPAAGENLVIVTKTRARRSPQHGINLTDLLSSNPLEFDVGADGKTVYHVERSLPGVIPSYSTYLTFSTPREIKPYHARVLVRLDWLEKVWGLPTHVWTPTPKDLVDRHSGSFVKGSVKFQELGPQFIAQFQREHQKSILEYKLPDGALGLARRSAQTVDVTALGDVYLDEVDIRTFGTRVHFKKPKDSWPLLIRGRLQVVAAAKPADGYYLCIRATSGYTTSKLDIPVLKLGETSVQADLSGLLQEGFLNVINSDFLLPHRPIRLVPEPADGAPFALRIADLYLQEHWLVATFEIYDRKTGMPYPNAANAEVKTWPKKSTLVDFMAQGTPVQGLPMEWLGDFKNLDPIAAEIVNLAPAMTSLRLTLSEPIALPKAQSYPLEDSVPALAAHFRDLFLNPWKKGTGAMEAKLDAAFLGSVLMRRFDKGATALMIPSGKGDLTVTRNGTETKCTGTLPRTQIKDLRIADVRIRDLDFEVKAIDLAATDNQPLTGSVTIQLHKADIEDLVNGLRCDSVSLQFLANEELEVTYATVHYKGGQFRADKLILGKNGKLHAKKK